MKSLKNYILNSTDEVNENFIAEYTPEEAIEFIYEKLSRKLTDSVKKTTNRTVKFSGKISRKFEGDNIYYTLTYTSENLDLFRLISPNAFLEVSFKFSILKDEITGKCVDINDKSYGDLNLIKNKINGDDAYRLGIFKLELKTFTLRYL